MEAKDHKKLAIDAFNKTWEFIDLPVRTKAQELEMIHLAHASRHHWAHAGGTELNLARGEWQISHMYSILGLGAQALYHAQAYFNSVIEHNFKDFDYVFAFEAMAYANKVLGNDDIKNEYLKKGYEAIDQCEKQADKDYCKSQLDLI